MRNMHDMQNIQKIIMQTKCKKYAQHTQNMKKIFKKICINMHNMQKHMQNICRIYAEYMHNMKKICKKYAKNMQNMQKIFRICKKYAKHMQ